MHAVIGPGGKEEEEAAEGKKGGGQGFLRGARKGMGEEVGGR